MSSGCPKYLKSLNLEIKYRESTERVYQIKSLEQGLRPTKFKEKEENDKQAKGMEKWLLREKENFGSQGRKSLKRERI